MLARALVLRLAQGGDHGLASRRSKCWPVVAVKPSRCSFEGPLGQTEGELCLVAEALSLRALAVRPCTSSSAVLGRCRRRACSWPRETVRSLGVSGTSSKCVLACDCFLVSFPSSIAPPASSSTSTTKVGVSYEAATGSICRGWPPATVGLSGSNRGIPVTDGAIGSMGFWFRVTSTDVPFLISLNLTGRNALRPSSVVEPLPDGNPAERPVRNVVSAVTFAKGA